MYIYREREREGDCTYIDNMLFITNPPMPHPASPTACDQGSEGWQGLGGGACGVGGRVGHCLGGVLQENNLYNIHLV